MAAYQILTGEEQRGPYTIEQLRSMWSSGQITADAQYWTEGMEAWQPIQALGLNLNLQATPKAPPTPWVTKGSWLRAIGCGLFLAFCIVAVIAANIIQRAVNSSPSTRKGTPKVAAVAGDGVVTIINTGTPDWKKMTVYINGRPPLGYKWEGAAPGVGIDHTKMIPLEEFKKDGASFSPKEEVWNISVGGDGYDYAYHDNK